MMVIGIESANCCRVDLAVVRRGAGRIVARLANGFDSIPLVRVEAFLAPPLTGIIGTGCAGSSNGRTTVFGAVRLGSNPSPAARFERASLPAFGKADSLACRPAAVPVDLAKALFTLAGDGMRRGTWARRRQVGVDRVVDAAVGRGRMHVFQHLVLISQTLQVRPSLALTGRVPADRVLLGRMSCFAAVVHSRFHVRRMTGRMLGRPS